MADACPPGAEFWQQPDVVAVLARQDVPALYRLLRDHGLSQRRIGRLTGHPQSEVSAVVAGRAVQSYAVLERIATRLGIPRGLMGLAYSPQADPAESPSGNRRAEDDDVQRRRFLAQASAAVLGSAVLGELGPLDPARLDMALPVKVGLGDVGRVTEVTRAIGDLDIRYGGGTCLGMARAHLAQATALLDARMTDETRRRLLVAVAELHGVNGWLAHDCGDHATGRHHYAREVELGRAADDPETVALALFKAARLEMHNHAPNDALKLLQLASALPLDRAPVARPYLVSWEAQAYAQLGLARPAIDRLSRTEDLSTATVERTGRWEPFSAAELACQRSEVYSALAGHDRTHLARAIPASEAALPGKGENWVRLRVRDAVLLATNHLRDGNVARGMQAGSQALALMPSLRSQRAIDWFAPLRREATTRPSCRPLAAEIDARTAPSATSRP